MKSVKEFPEVFENYEIELIYFAFRHSWSKILEKWTYFLSNLDLVS